MSDYFKFCPKCGRVLDRDWCPHCEPEKEKKFRQDQLKLDRSMLENYGKDAGVGHLFSGKKPKKIAFESRKTAKKVSESSRAEKKGQSKFSWTKILAAAIVIIPWLFSFFEINPSRLFHHFSLPAPVESVISFFGITSVTEEGYEDISSDDSVQDLDYMVQMEVMPEDDGDGILYTVDGEDFSWQITRPVLYSEIGSDSESSAQDEIDKICSQWYQEGLKAKKEKKAVDGTLQAYTTYLDDDTACIVLQGFRYYSDGSSEDEEELYSFIINLDEMTVYDPLEEEVLDTDDLYDDMSDQSDTTLTREAFSEMLEAGEYCTIADSDGNLWIGFIDDSEGGGQTVNVRLDRSLSD